MSELRKDIGERIKKSRKAVKVTQQAMADALSISRQTVIDMENGKTPPKTDHLEAISKIIKKPIDWIVTGDDPKASIAKMIDSIPEHEEEMFLNEIMDLINEELGGKLCGEE